MSAPAPNYPDADRGVSLAATYITGCVVSLVFVVMRLCARYSIAGVGIDDWLMLVTWIAFVPVTVLLCILCVNGGTRHLAYLAADPDKLVWSIKMNWISQPFVIFCLGTGKVAVSFLIIRLLNRASIWRRYSLYFASALTVANTIIMIVLTFAQCSTPAALWDQELKERTKCWNPQVQSSFSIYGAAVHTAMDFFLAGLPITLVWGLQTDLRKKIALCALLGCGALTGICAGVKTSKLLSLNERSDITWETVPLFMWSGIEIILLIVCGSIPALKPIYSICLGKRSFTLRSSQRNTLSAKKNNNSRRSYIRQRDDTEASLGLNNVTQPSAVHVSRMSEDEIAMTGRFDKEGTIQITKTFDIQRD
ncbi:hypothetical protein BU24DRAFT_497104 [Aaosphaeria arxii CBS 175.79]|uniref:Rhodopsin domain-containing protein n=1 Tax=Aaosphaeria arxii CBS 175.79 TaxID=1450172 RepID=A0A6A5X9A6_9PLEO|nr:uncharacterized protein BU24DRAFT_497104 [Aaosphaeria arxii CBS 175.79]KAF2009489.1 hypothetical protein BU24DRAFT_497104 [Aaosphaeria arxii CBS 175.79]